VLAAADRAFDGLDRAEWPQAIAARARIGERRAGARAPRSTPVDAAAFDAKRSAAQQTTHVDFALRGG
jgi:hypothetical protein